MTRSRLELLHKDEILDGGLDRPGSGWWRGIIGPTKESPNCINYIKSLLSYRLISKSSGRSNFLDSAALENRFFFLFLLPPPSPPTLALGTSHLY